ncbi:tryptophan leader peptide [Paraburkholderia sp. UCT31]|uniref:tryptophan leader peptide n=1 Tax=Paraburkholderia sp. UCT31 TaxID=2615209 RepID=UPI0016561B64|nr:tryptophan leader peptide [Paraburkholderia sp. UCT31]MBC8737110.1 tryptophan leader peptide [Paraburkholderia sp. UCT31]
MAWKFWKTEKRAAAPTPNWPTDTHEALRLLLGMLMRADSPPFSTWNAPGIVFAPRVDTTAQSAAKGYQLALWFWLFAEKHGGTAAKMTRDSFCLLAADAQPALGDVLDNLVELENRLVHSFEATQGEQRNVKRNGQSLELPMELFVAKGFLRQAPESPYFGQDNADLEGNDFKLADCLRHASEQALAVFRPMIDVVAFDPQSLPSWKWSAQPGARERHLQRRYNNPLFPLHRRMVTSNDVYEARLSDAQTLTDIRQELAEIAREFSEKAALPSDWHPFLNNFRERLDQLEDRRIVAGGQSAALAAAIAELRGNIVAVWRSAIEKSKNRRSLAALEQAEALRAERHAALHASEWTSQLLSRTSLIPPEEVVAALLSEPPAELEKAVTTLQANPQLHDTLANCRSAGLRLVAEARAAGHPLADIDEKLRILGGAPGQVPA